MVDSNIVILDEKFAELVREFMEQFIGVKLNQHTILHMQAVCHLIEHRLEEVLPAPPNHTYKVVLSLEERIGQVVIGYQVVPKESPEGGLCTKSIRGFQRLLP